MENEKKKSPQQSISTIVELQRRIRQLEYVVNHLQQRLGGVAASYELEIALAKSETELLKLYGDQEQEVD
jgi:hypothetical protein